VSKTVLHSLLHKASFSLQTFCVICVNLVVATGLFYLAELVEEYTSTSARVIKYMTYVSYHVLLYAIDYEQVRVEAKHSSRTGV